MAAIEHHLLVVYGDTDPVLKPKVLYPGTVLAQARKHRANDPDATDGLYRVRIDWKRRQIEVAPFGTRELEEHDE